MRKNAWLSNADDHSLVKLKSTSKRSKGEYINASYVDGWDRDKAYIATQGEDGPHHLSSQSRFLYYSSLASLSIRTFARNLWGVLADGLGAENCHDCHDHEPHRTRTGESEALSLSGNRNVRVMRERGERKRGGGKLEGRRDGEVSFLGSCQAIMTMRCHAGKT